MPSPSQNRQESARAGEGQAQRAGLWHWNGLVARRLPNRLTGPWRLEKPVPCAELGPAGSFLLRPLSVCRQSSSPAVLT